jgi:hypothetical protein
LVLGHLGVTDVVGDEFLERVQPLVELFAVTTDPTTTTDHRMPRRSVTSVCRPQTRPTSPPALREAGQAGQVTGLDEACVNYRQAGE